MATELLPNPVSFAKLTAGGNDFVVLNNATGAFDSLFASDALPGIVRQICPRGLSVGADGVIFAGAVGNGGGGVDICARFFEPDGSEAELCGNGTACFVYWAISKGLVPGPNVTVLTAAGTAVGKKVDDGPGRVSVCVPDPSDIEPDIELMVKGDAWLVHHIVTGVPHVVTFVDGLEHLDVWHWGPGIRHHERFAPRGVNVNFVEIIGVGRIAVRTFEFGVENETLACGTGSAASAVITCLRENWPREFRRHERPIEVLVRGGETLKIWFNCEDGSATITDLCLETRARPIYEAELSAEFITELWAAG